MTSAKIWDFWTPLSLSHSRNLSVLLSAYEPAPSSLSADVICEQPLGAEENERLISDRSSVTMEMSGTARKAHGHDVEPCTYD